MSKRLVEQVSRELSSKKAIREVRRWTSIASEVLLSLVLFSQLGHLKLFSSILGKASTRVALRINSTDCYTTSTKVVPYFPDHPRISDYIHLSLTR